MARDAGAIQRRTLIVAHGDLDGIVSAVLVARDWHDSWKEFGGQAETLVTFVQPFTLDKVEVEEVEAVFVVDIAVNNRNPQQTLDFVERLGDKLYRWYDHHHGWEGLVDDDERFIIDEEALSCASILCEEDNWTPLAADATAADTRQGSLSKKADLIERACKADLSDDSVREAAFYWLLGDENQRSVLESAAERYAAIQAETERLSATYQVTGNVAVVDARESERNYDRTQLLLAGQGLAPFAVVVSQNLRAGEDYLTIATRRKDVSLVEVFGLPSGAPFRVSIPASRLDEALGKLNSL